MLKEAEGGQTLATGVIGRIVQDQDMTPGGKLVDEQMLQKCDEGLTILLVTHGPRDRIIRPIVGGKNMLGLLYTGCWHEGLLSPFRPTGT